MPVILRLSAAVGIAIVATVVCEWTDPFYAILGSIPAAIAGAVLGILIFLTRPAQSERKYAERNPIQNVLVGALAGATWVAVMVLYFTVVKQVPAIASGMLDGNRAAVEQSLKILESKGEWLAADALCEEELQRTHTPAWTKELAERRVRYLITASEKTPEQAELLTQTALDVSRWHGLPTELLTRAVQRMATDREANAARVQFKQQLETDAAAKIRSAEEAAAKLRRSLEAGKSDAESRYRQAIIRWVEDHLKLRQDAAEIALQPDGQLPRVRESLAKDIAAAVRQGLNVEVARRSLTRLDGEIALRTPRALAPGTTARILRLPPSPASNLLLVDIAVTGADRGACLGLTQRDFALRQGERLLRASVEPMIRNGKLYLGVLLDVSGSMQGTRLQSMQPAAIGLLEQLTRETHIRLSAFNDRITLLADWSARSTAAIESCRRLQAAGGTALLAAIMESIESLSKIPEASSRVLVVFSDGANSAPGPSIESLVAAAKRQHVTIHFIALKSPADDTSAIESLAAQTQGRTLLAANTNELAAKFRQIANELNETGYRLGALDYEPAQPVSITIGGEHAVQCAITGRDREAFAKRPTY